MNVPVVASLRGHPALRARSNGGEPSDGGEGRNENSPPSEGWQPQADGVVV